MRHNASTWPQVMSPRLAAAVSTTVPQSWAVEACTSVSLACARASLAARVTRWLPARRALPALVHGRLQASKSCLANRSQSGCSDSPDPSREKVRRRLPARIFGAQQPDLGGDAGKVVLMRVVAQRAEIDARRRGPPPAGWDPAAWADQHPRARQGLFRATGVGNLGDREAGDRRSRHRRCAEGRGGRVVRALRVQGGAETPSMRRATRSGRFTDMPETFPGWRGRREGEAFRGSRDRCAR